LIAPSFKNLEKKLKENKKLYLILFDEDDM
jgi:hypothetical protein